MLRSEISPGETSKSKPCEVERGALALWGRWTGPIKKKGRKSTDRRSKKRIFKARSKKLLVFLRGLFYRVDLGKRAIGQQAARMKSRFGLEMS